MPDLRVKLGPLELKNPVMTASGTFGYGSEYEEFFAPSLLGAVVVKGVAAKPVHGNPTPRVAEVTSGMINAIGLQGPGVDKFLHDEHYMPYLKRSGSTVIENIWGKSVDEYRYVAERLDAESMSPVPTSKRGGFRSVPIPGQWERSSPPSAPRQNFPSLPNSARTSKACPNSQRPPQTTEAISFP